MHHAPDLITNYELRIRNYELGITNYELRITNYELRITDYGLRIRNYEMDGAGGGADVGYGNKGVEGDCTMHRVCVICG